jgi:hypothetical protein
LEAATMAEDFKETDEKLGEDGKRRFNFMLGRHSHHWEHAQQARILSLVLSERISSTRRWATSLITKTWLTSLMRHVGAAKLHFPSTYLTMTETMTFTVNSRIRELWTCQNVWPLHGSLVYLLK